MATVYQKTDNYGLDLYGDNDPADLRDGHNTNMRTIDGKLKDHSDELAIIKTKADSAAPQATTYTKTEVDEKTNAIQEKVNTNSDIIKELPTNIEINNVVTMFGVDNTGSRDTTKDIKNAIADSSAMLFFPPGTYLISSPITLEYHSIVGSGSSMTKIKAIATMDYMLDIGPLNYFEKKQVQGLQLNANNLSQKGTIGGQQCWMNDITVIDALSVGIDGTHAQGARIDNVYAIVHSDGASATSTGIILPNDTICGKIVSWGMKTGLNFNGVNNLISQYSYWCGTNVNKTTAIICNTKGDNTISQAYFDSVNIAIDNSVYCILSFGEIVLYLNNQDYNNQDFIFLDAKDKGNTSVFANFATFNGNVDSSIISPIKNEENIKFTNFHVFGCFINTDYYRNGKITPEAFTFDILPNGTGKWYKIGHVRIHQKFVGIILLLRMYRFEKAAKIFLDFSIRSIFAERWLTKDAGGVSVGFQQTDANGLEFDIIVNADNASANMNIIYQYSAINDRIDCPTFISGYQPVTLASNAVTKELTL